MVIISHHWCFTLQTSMCPCYFYDVCHCTPSICGLWSHTCLETDRFASNFTLDFVYLLCTLKWNVKALT